MSEGVGTAPGIRIVNGRQVPEVGVWEIDPAHAAFEFVARHLMAKVRGRFPAVSGVATIAERVGCAKSDVASELPGRSSIAG